ncbi:glutamate--cysteine ligase regulatory subunit-like isoform X2 [Myxocyprinus asiaticus]|uniref:glutamate--cysteine ligase regulatory subunit-like isoform X2 n=1 Tax=Myxocyprinus asiaticus TaxID=70543 RepID=UPI0022221B9F|nr:glutamate--cysteine ligase regulatory subunit-like isoform X2 [Myxocyprinus asiaticus]
MESHVNAKRLFNHAQTLKLHTGNLVSRSRLKKKCPSSPSEELQDCIQGTLSEWFASIPSTLDCELPCVLDCTIPENTEAITPEERDELKVSVKLFLSESDPSSIRNAVDMGVSQLDSVIIAPPSLPEGEAQTLAHLQPLWEELEGLVHSQKIAAIGTSDLDKTLLEQLYNWAQVKPSSNQVNLASCCVMPPDLTAFAKEFDIQLLTHNDPKELISAAGFQEAVQKSSKELHVADWRLEWVLRYSIIVKSRGIIKSKGYIVHAKKSSDH